MQKELMNTEQAAKYLDMSKSWLTQNRFNAGPGMIRFIKIGRAVKYRKTDLDEFIELKAKETERCG